MKLKEGTILKSSTREYKVESVLGSGGFGITYKVTTEIQIGTSKMIQTFALKEHFVKKCCERDSTGRVTCSNPSLEIVNTTKADFIAEAQRLRNIKHHNIVKVQEVFEANNTAYYAMDYLNGENLRNYVLARKRLNVSEVFELLLPICDAIKAIHNNKTTHLDIKPANVMLKQLMGGAIVPILIDFGLSKHYDKDGNATSTMRTQGCSEGYSPVEQYIGIDSFSPQADIYSLAATFVFCLTGKRPPRSSDLEDATSIANLMPEDININVRSAIVHAMVQSRKKRTRTIEEFINELRNGCAEYLEVCRENYLDLLKEINDEGPKNSSQNVSSNSFMQKKDSSGAISTSSSVSQSNGLSPTILNKAISDVEVVYDSQSQISELANSDKQPLLSDSKNVTSQVVSSTKDKFNKTPEIETVGKNERKEISYPRTPISNSNQMVGGNLHNTIAPQDRQSILGKGGFNENKNKTLNAIIGVVVALILIVAIILGIVFYMPTETSASMNIEKSQSTEGYLTDTLSTDSVF